LEWSLKALIVLVLAGFGTIGGAFITGLLLGVMESITGLFIGSYMMVATLMIFLLILIFRPQGLFKRK
jgi:branched-chain amino acid transport system permease protein